MPLAKGQLAADRNPNWKGGRSVSSNGYVLLKRPDHPQADSRGYVYEHRVVAEEMLGRPLRKGEKVHHLNGDKTDNARTNLRVEPSHAHHAREHRKTSARLRDPGEANPSIECACGCGATFDLFDRWGRARSYVSGHNGSRGARGQFTV